MCVSYTWVALINDINVLHCVLLFCKLPFLLLYQQLLQRKKLYQSSPHPLLYFFFGGHKLVVLAPCGVHATLKELVMLQSKKNIRIDSSSIKSISPNFFIFGIYWTKNRKQCSVESNGHPGGPVRTLFSQPPSAAQFPHLLAKELASVQRLILH